MSKRALKKSKRRSKAVLPALGLTGLSLSLASGATASTGEVTTNLPSTSQPHELFLGEEWLPMRRLSMRLERLLGLRRLRLGLRRLLPVLGLAVLPLVLNRTPGGGSGPSASRSSSLPLAERPPRNNAAMAAGKA